MLVPPVTTLLLSLSFLIPHPTEGLYVTMLSPVCDHFFRLLYLIGNMLLINNIKIQAMDRKKLLAIFLYNTQSSEFIYNNSCKLVDKRQKQKNGQGM